MKKFFSEFKKFISRGNVLDLAVGVIIGGAFTAIVTALTNGVLKPLINYVISLIIGGDDATGIYTFLKVVKDGDGVVDMAASIYIDWGALISAIINFFLIAFVLFLIIKAINKAKELGADVIVQNAGNNIEEQNRQLLYLMNRTDAIVVLPKDAASITETIQKIRAKGIPVISYDRLTLNADINLYMTIDSEKVGETMALEMMRHTSGTNWYCILGPKEDYNMTLINDGITRIVRNSNVNINHVFYTDNWNYDLSYQ